MSRKVIEDLVLPIVVRKLCKQGELPRYSRYTTISDRRLADFFEEQLVKEFSIVGEVGGKCEALEYILEDLADRNPAYLDAEVERILKLYLNLRVIEAQVTGYSEPRPPQPSYNKTPAMCARKRRYT